MAAPVKLKPSRVAPNFNVTHDIRIRINQAAPDPAKGERAIVAGAANKIHIGTVPAGALLLPGFVAIETAFDGTAPTLDVGSDSVAAAYMTSAAIAPATAKGTTQVASPTTLKRVDVDTPVYLTFTQTSGNTVGIADIVLPFYPMKD